MTEEPTQKQINDQKKELKLRTEDLQRKVAYWKAEYEIRYYTLETQKLQPAYDQFLKEEEALRMKMIADREELMERLQNQVSQANTPAEAPAPALMEE